MPILAREPDLFPEDLLDRLQLGEADGLRWLALHCRPRREKALMRCLQKLQVPFYSPLIARRTTSPSGRGFTSYVPLFSGYVFVCGDGDCRYSAQATGCVSRCLDVPDSVQLTVDLRQIRRMTLSGVPLTPEGRIEKGVRVRIRAGHFAGLEGIVVRRVNQQPRLIIAVNFLQQGAALSLDDYQVERLD